MNRTDMNKQIKGYKAGRKVRKKPETNENMVEKYGNTAVNTLSGMALGAGAYGGKLANDARKFRNRQDALRRQAHMERFKNRPNPKTMEMPKFLRNQINPDMVGGREGQNIVQGGGGFGNVTQFGKGKGPPKKNMKKGGKVKKSSKPRGCGVAKKGVRKARYI
jgi:hypothetical protein